MKTVGIILPNTGNSFFSGLADQLHIQLGKAGYAALIFPCGNSADREKEAYAVLLNAGCEGIISVSGLSEFPEDLVPENYPLVWVDRVPCSNRIIPWVSNDDEMAMKIAADYLIEKGCRNILLMPGYLAEQQESPRVKGYLKSLAKHGIEFRETYVLNRAGKAPSETETQQLIREFLGSGNPADAIITASDRAAFGAMTALETIGCYVPEDVKLISFDNSPYTAMASPGITALDRRPDLLAEEAVKVMTDLLKGSETACEHVIPVTLAERASAR